MDIFPSRRKRWAHPPWSHAINSRGTWPDSTALSNIDLVKKICYSSVTNKCVAVEEISPDTVGMFDVTLFLGVLYHAPDMMGYLKNVRSITKEMAVVETLWWMDCISTSRTQPSNPPKRVNNDASNWWGPNIACVLEMLKRAGFSRANFISLWDVNAIEKTRGSTQDEAQRRAVRNGRAVFHAYV